MNIRKQIRESKDVSLYTKLLHVLGDYSTSFPMTGVSSLFDVAVKEGKKILPKDKRAIEILEYILSTDPCPAAVQKLLNMRFADLPTECKPISKNGRRKEVAFWYKDNAANDRIKSLIDFDLTSKKGKWTDMDGKAVTLIDMKSGKRQTEDDEKNISLTGVYNEIS